MPRTKALGLHLSVALLTWLAGCSGTPAKPPLTANLAQREVTVSHLRAIAYEYASRFGQMVASTAIEIAARTENPAARDLAYQWRMWGAPQARAAAFDEDPLAGLLELWVLAGQQLEYFTEGEGNRIFADQQQLAVRAAARLEQEARDLAAEVIAQDRFAQVSERVGQWIAAHPIEGRFYLRPTARADVAALGPPETQTGFQAVGSIEESLRDLNARLAIVSMQLPEEARWQAEYLVRALFEEQLEQPTASILEAIDGVDGFLGDFEGVLSAQTEALLDGVQREREAVFDAMGQAREGIVQSVERQRTSIMNAVDDRLAAATDRLEETGRSLIDHFFARLIQVLVGMALFVLAALGLAAWLASRQRRN